MQTKGTIFSKSTLFMSEKLKLKTKKNDQHITIKLGLWEKGKKSPIRNKRIITGITKVHKTKFQQKNKYTKGRENQTPQQRNPQWTALVKVITKTYKQLEKGMQWRGHLWVYSPRHGHVKPQVDISVFLVALYHTVWDRFSH